VVWQLFAKKWKFLPFCGLHSHPQALTDVKFCTAKQTRVPLSRAKFHVNWCNESPLQGKNADLWPVSKFNTSSLPLHVILSVKICLVLQYYTCLMANFQENHSVLLQQEMPEVAVVVELLELLKKCKVLVRSPPPA